LHVKLGRRKIPQTKNAEEKKVKIYSKLTTSCNVYHAIYGINTVPQLTLTATLCDTLTLDFYVKLKTTDMYLSIAKNLVCT